LQITFCSQFRKIIFFSIVFSVSIALSLCLLNLMKPFLAILEVFCYNRIKIKPGYLQIMDNALIMIFEGKIHLTYANMVKSDSFVRLSLRSEHSFFQVLLLFVWVFLQFIGALDSLHYTFWLTHSSFSLFILTQVSFQHSFCSVSWIIQLTYYLTDLLFYKFITHSQVDKPVVTVHQGN